MKLSREVNRRIRLNIMVLIVAVLSTGLVSCSEPPESESVLLHLKGQAGKEYQHLDTSIARHITKWPDGKENVMESQMRVTVKTQVESVGRKGRMILYQRIARMVFQKAFNGKWIFPPFDSSNPSDIEAIKNKPEWAHFLAFLESSWKLEQDATREIIDYEIITPQKTAPAGFELVFKNFVESLIEDEKIFFPRQAVTIGESWDRETKAIVFPKIGRIERNVKCTLSKISMQDGEQTAVINLDVTGTFSADIDDAAEVKLRKFKEGGTLLFAIKRGRIKHIYTKQEVIIYYRGKPEPHTIHNITEKTVEELRQ